MDTASLLVDEAHDVSIKEQMAIVLHYVDTNGCIIERFLDISHVLDTSARSLKASIELMFAKNGLSLTCVRGQGYDGASNMRGQFNGLKSLILEDNKSAFYVHCLTHQLQLTLVACVKKIQPLKYFFDHLALLCTVVDASSKRKDLLRVKRAKEVIESLASGELETGQGLNQEITLKRVGDTHWGSHYGTIVSLILLFNPTLDVLEAISEDGPSEEKRTEAAGLMKNMQKFKFVFLLQLMSKELEITNELSQALQKKDQDIVNTMILVETSKTMLQELRDNEWDHLFKKTCDFCAKHDIDVPDMKKILALHGREKRSAQRVTHLQHFKYDVFFTVIDTQLHELNYRFNNVNTRLLLSMACLDPHRNFSAYDNSKLLEFAGFYPVEFSDSYNFCNTN